MIKFKGIFMFHKSTLAPMLVSGMACSSVRRQRNSPATHVMQAHDTLSAHHENVVGNEPLYSQHASRWMPWYVQLKSKHSLVLPTMVQSVNAPIIAFSTNANITDRPSLSRTCISWYSKMWSRVLVDPVMSCIRAMIKHNEQYRTDCIATICATIRQGSHCV